MESLNLKLDFRFADEMDGVELVPFVNDAHSLEFEPESDMAFRKEGPIVTVDEVEADLVSMPVKWLVLETPVPEEAIVGAARLKQDTSRNGHVDCFCVTRQGSEEVRTAITKRLLSKVETVCYNLGLQSCIVEAPQWRVDLEALLTPCGYEELSGHIWPEDRQEQLLKPTMVLEYHKVFPSANHGRDKAEKAVLQHAAGEKEEEEEEEEEEEGASGDIKSPQDAQSGVEAAGGTIASALLEGLDLSSLDVGASGTGTGAGPRGEDMPQLMNTLFAALHAEYGTEK